MRIHPVVPLFVLVFTSLFVRPAGAANGGSAIALGTDGIRAPLLTIAQPDSGALVIYVDTDQIPVGVYAQRVDRYGRPLLGKKGVLVVGSVSLDTEGIKPDGAGGCIVAWGENRGATGKDIIIQRVLGDGSLAYGPTGLVVCNASRAQDWPGVTAGPAGSFYVSWSDDRANAGAFDIYVQRVSLAGAAQWTANGVAVTTVSTRTWDNYVPAAVSDFSGGIILTWPPSSFGAPRAQRLNSSGTPQWAAGGVTFAAANVAPDVVAPDGAGGLWVTNSTWDGTFGRAILHHVLSNGASGFPAAGIEIASAYQNNALVALMRNASGGCYSYSTQAGSAPSQPVYLQEVNAAGQLLRAPGGKFLFYAGELPELLDLGDAYLLSYFEPAVSTARKRMRFQRFALDNTPTFPNGGIVVGPETHIPNMSYGSLGALSNGVIVATWGDWRYKSYIGFYTQVFGQAVTPAGAPLWNDSEAPVLQSVGDAPGDQGGRVRVTWDSGTPDDPVIATAQGYRVWRALTTAAAAALPAPADMVAAARGPATAETADTPYMFRAGDRTLLVHANSYWELAGEQIASTLPSYARTVTTLRDSTAGSPADELFMVEAYDDSSHHWFSGTLTGHSVDNLPPGAVSSAVGYYNGGSTALYWGGVSDADLCCYEVFRGSTPGFVPGPSNQIGSTAAVTYTDPSGAPWYYRIAARDVHGNLGPSALVTPAGTTDTESEGPRAWALRTRWLAGAQAIEFALDVPEAGEGSLELFDVTGRRLWHAPFRAETARQLLVRAAPVGGLRSGVVYARATSRGGRVLVAKAVVLR